MRTLSDTLTPTLQAIRQKEFYPDPRFHASIAWALLDPSPHTPTPIRSPSPPNRPEPPSPAHFPTIPHFPPTLIPTLTAQYGPALASAKVGMFEVDALHVKIGKDVCSWRLM